MSLSADAVRHLLYPLGYIASALFGLRFIWQWLQSEKAGRTFVDRLFWQMSLVGNLLMAAHYFIQVHFALFLSQAINAFYARRNLQLLQGAQKLSVGARILAILLLSAFAAILFLVQSWALIGYIDWVRNPHAHSHTSTLSLSWHLFGFLGLCIFSIRFWVQWWQAETKGQSELGLWFWWLSLLGAVLLCFYARFMQDPVTLISNALPLAGYARNIFLTWRRQKQSKSSAIQEVNSDG